MSCTCKMRLMLLRWSLQASQLLGKTASAVWGGGTDLTSGAVAFLCLRLVFRPSGKLSGASARVTRPSKWRLCRCEVFLFASVQARASPWKLFFPYSLCFHDLRSGLLKANSTLEEKTRKNYTSHCFSLQFVSLQIARRPHKKEQHFLAVWCKRMSLFWQHVDQATVSTGFYSWLLNNSLFQSVINFVLSWISHIAQTQQIISWSESWDYDELPQSKPKNLRKAPSSALQMILSDKTTSIWWAAETAELDTPQLPFVKCWSLVLLGYTQHQMLSTLIEGEKIFLKQFIAFWSTSLQIFKVSFITTQWWDHKNEISALFFVKKKKNPLFIFLKFH